MAEGLSSGEPQELTYALESRFEPHLEAAASAVRDAERALEEAREALTRTEQQQERETYTSDPLPFMREGVAEEVDGLERKTTPKKVRAAYRFLLDRAAELAAAEVQGFQDDRAELERERSDGVAACRDEVDRATAALAAAREVQERVEAAEQAARQGLNMMVSKLSEGS